MTDAILTHDAGVAAFEDAGGVVSTADDDEVQFNWDEQHIVKVDAPADLEGAFDTDRFYKIEGATVARPIKQPYMVGDDIEWYKKPAEELERAAWSFDNAPFTLGHPDTGMVKNVDDIHGFWRNARYDNDEERLKSDLYVPKADDEALAFIEENSDVSIGFYNRVHSDYDGNTGDLTDDDVDGFQVDIYGNHIAGVEQGRCSSEQSCGLDGDNHGTVVMRTDQSTVFEQEQNMTEQSAMFSEGDEVMWSADAVVAHNPDDEDGVMIEILDRDGESTEMVITVDEEDIFHKRDVMRDNTDSADCPCPTVDAPSGIYTEDGTWYGIAPSETADDEPKYELDNCNDVKDAWNLRGSGDYDIEQSTLENRIQRAAEAHDCPPENKPWETEDSNMADDDSDSTTDSQEFDIPDLSVDALAEKNSAVQDLKESRDSLREDLDEMEDEIETALDAAENFAIELEEDECVCEAVDELVSDLDEKVEEVEDLRDELSEYREDDIEDKLDTLEDLGADREEWRETADEADSPIEALDEEIERREEVLEANDVSVKDIRTSTDDDNGDDSADKTVGGSRTFGRGHSA